MGYATGDPAFGFDQGPSKETDSAEPDSPVLSRIAYPTLPFPEGSTGQWLCLRVPRPGVGFRYTAVALSVRAFPSKPPAPLI